MPETEEEKKKRWAAAAATSYMTPQMRHALSMSKQQSQNKYKESFDKLKGKGMNVTTPEMENAKRMSSIVSKSKYTSDFEKNRLKFTQVADTPENVRLQKLTIQISDNAYKGKELASTKNRRRREEKTAKAELQKSKAAEPAKHTVDDAQPEAPAQEQDKPEVREMSHTQQQEYDEYFEEDISDDPTQNDIYDPPVKEDQHVPEEQNVAEESYEQQENKVEESYDQQQDVAEESYEPQVTNGYNQDSYNQPQEDVKDETGGEYQGDNGYDERGYDNGADYQAEENIYDTAADEQGYNEGQSQDQYEHEPTYEAPPASSDGLDDFYANLG